MNIMQEEFQGRLARLQQLIKAKEIDLVVLNQNPDLYYLTGSVQPLYLLVPAEGQAVILTRKGATRIRSEVPQLPCEVFRNTRDMARFIEKYHLTGAKRMGFTLENTAFATVRRFLDLLPAAAPVDLSQEMRYLRMVKSEAEITIITEGGRIMAGIPQVVREGFRPGMTELELSALIENYLRLQGHGGIIRSRREAMEINNGVCAFGATALAGNKFDAICTGTGLNAAIPYGASRQQITPGQPVILDYGFNFQGYHVDQTRMFCLGTPPAEAVKAFQVMLEVEEMLMEELKPGKLWSELYESAKNLAADLGYGAEFMGLGEEKVRFVGHGVGLELDEPPYLAPKMDFPIEAGMVIALEPKVALPGMGVIGNEDTVLVREDGCESLTVAAPGMIEVEG